MRLLEKIKQSQSLSKFIIWWSTQTNQTRGFAIAAMFAIIGTATVLATHAQKIFVILELDTGARSGNTAIVADPSAAGGKYVIFSTNPPKTTTTPASKAGNQATQSGSGSSAPSGQPIVEPEPIAGQGYRKVWYDEFDVLNQNVWALHEPWFFAPPAGAVTASNGTLKLTSRASDGYPEIEISTLGQRTGTAPPYYPSTTTFQKGYFEARMRYTDSPHSWPAFWLFGEHRAQWYPQSPCPILQGEWDIMENHQPPNDGLHAGTLHNTSSSCGVPQQLRQFEKFVGFNLSGWHVYGGRWVDGELCTYVDGVLAGCLEPYTSINQPMLIQFSEQGHCADWEGTGCNVPKPSELTTEIDWVRVWQK